MQKQRNASQLFFQPDIRSIHRFDAKATHG